jgi:hypothetical protein
MMRDGVKWKRKRSMRKVVMHHFMSDLKVGHQLLLLLLSHGDCNGHRCA